MVSVGYEGVDGDAGDGDEVGREVWMVLSNALSTVADLLPSNVGRQSLVTSLIQAYDLHSKCQGIVPVVKANKRDLQTYHDEGFVNFLLRRRTELDESVDNHSHIKPLVNLPVYSMMPNSGLAADAVVVSDEVVIEVEEEDSKEDLQKYGLLYDCYPFPFMADYVQLVAGSSLSSTRALIQHHQPGSRTHTIVINWYGGRHHCHKTKAAGFCYINDIILSIQLLRKSFSRVFYLDLDLHHGNGVENAYKFSKNVFTCSIHRYDIGFYPGTGSLESSTAKMINIPTKRGLNDVTMMKIVDNIVIPLIQDFQPQAIILQAGCDGLSTDEHNEWNLSIKGFGDIVDYILNEIDGIPTLILGGGGYNHTETAKCWTYITSKVLRHKLVCETIPEHEHLDSYEKDGFQFWTASNSNPKKMTDENSDEYLTTLQNHILKL